jgi:HEAT repeat protein
MKALPAVLIAALLFAAASAGEKSPVERLKADNAEVEAAAARELVAGDEKYMKEIAAAFDALKDDQRKLRERYRDAVARIRTAQVRKWALKLAPGLEKKFKWDGLVRYLTWTTRLASPTDARRAFCLITRSAEGWEEAEGVKVLGECLKDDSLEVRRAAVSALDRNEWKAAAVDLLVSALKDKNEIVRVEAGSILVARGDQRGLAAILAGALSTDREVADACISTVNGLIVSDEKGQRPRFKHGAEEIKVLTSLLALKPWNSRGTVIRLLGMIGDPAAAKPLLEHLSKEDNPKNRRRIATSLSQLHHRPAAAAIAGVLGRKLYATKKNYNWPVAANWGSLGDPGAVPAMIALLDGDWKHRGRYAAAALSYAFGGTEAMGEPPLRGTPGYLVVPASAEKLVVRPEKNVPAPAELKKLWEAWWAKNKASFKWSEKGAGLRTKVAKE